MKKRFGILILGCAAFFSCMTPSPQLQLAETILNDSTFHQVDSMARSVIRQGFNAGSGYSQIWARDMNTFIEVACEETNQTDIRNAILLFFALQQPNDEMIDGYVLKPDFTWYDNHPYYVQQLAQQVWLRTSQKADLNLVEAAYNGLIDQLSLLFLNLMETFSNAQIAFLHALIAGEKQLSSKRVLQKYTIGTSGNVVRIRQNLIEREILDTKEDALVFQDPLFEGWLRKCYFKCGE